MSTATLLSKIEAFAARTPTESKDIDGILKLIVEITRRQFDAYLVDIMWESGQGHRTELDLVAAHETEQHGYKGLPIYDNDKAPAKPDSLTGWSYEKNQPVWIVDADGLKRNNEYENRWSDTSHPIPSGTIFEYNKAKICTEICHPLRTYVHNASRRAAGVLNIELRAPIHPSPLAKSFISGVASVIEQLQNRKHASQTADDYARAAIRGLSELKAAMMGEDEPGFHPKAFVAFPMSTPFSNDQKKWVEQTLNRRGIKCAWPETNGDITEAIWKKIRTAHFGVVISTGYNPNVMFEWGYLLGCKKPVIRLHSPTGGGQQDPFDVASGRSWSLNRPGEGFTEASVSEVLNKAIDQLMHDNPELAALVGSNGRENGAS